MAAENPIDAATRDIVARAQDGMPVVNAIAAVADLARAWGNEAPPADKSQVQAKLRELAERLQSEGRQRSGTIVGTALEAAADAANLAAVGDG